MKLTSSRQWIPVIGTHYDCFPVYLGYQPLCQLIVHPIRRLVAQRLIRSQPEVVNVI